MQARFGSTVTEEGGVKIVVLFDNNDGAKTITNDAEAVVEHLLRQFDGRRFFYKDTEGDFGELKHDGAKFTGFGPGPEDSDAPDWAAFFKAEAEAAAGQG